MKKIIMPNKPLVILHGWSDSSESFKPLADALRARLNTSITLINLADYQSMDDEVTFDDLAEAMQAAWKKNQLPSSPYSADMIVHSTGGLVVRYWLQKFFTPNNSPIKNLVMLAPANFGSPLAHKGKSFIGRIVKGFKSDKPFQVGEKILNGLELASPFTFALALNDRFGDKIFFDAGKTLCTVFVGNTGYSGISAAANENGSDGTVRVSTANLNCAKLSVNLSDEVTLADSPLLHSKGMTAFGVLDKENHGTITMKSGSFENKQTLPLIIEALCVDNAGFKKFCTKLETLTASTMKKYKKDEYKHGYQNMVVVVKDTYGSFVDDYFLEFYVEDDDENIFAKLFHYNVIETVHAYGSNKAYRSIYIDCTVLRDKVDKPKEGMRISLSALPELDENGNVGYKTFSNEEGKAIRISKKEIDLLFVENRTLLVEILLKRYQTDKVFKLTRY